MKPQEQTIDPQRIDRLSEAADWLMRLEKPTRSESDYSDWLRWCDAHPQNLAAFETMQGKWQALDALKAETDLLDAVGTSVKDSPSFLRAHKWLALAAGVSVIAVGLAVFHYQQPPAAPAEKVTAVSTNRAATLPDGSRMILGAQSRVDVDFNGPQRRLELSSGEAYFKVKHDKARPFVVQAGEVSVTAIGTAFDVRRAADKVTITVEEGTVEVRALASGKEGREGEPTVWRAEAGYQVTYSIRPRTASIASIDPSVELAWRNGELSYLYEPLGAVVEDLNRYSNRRIVIADPRVGKIPFTGTAFAASLDGWLVGIEQAYPVVVNRTASGDIVLNSRD